MATIKKGAKKPLPKKKKVVLQDILVEAGERIAYERFKQKKPLKDLAEESGVSGVTISNLEKGNLENTTLSVLLNISNALGMDFSINFE